MHCHAPSEGSDPLPCYPYNWRERVREREREREGGRDQEGSDHISLRKISPYFHQFIFLDGYTCNICQQKFRSKNAADVHFREEHPYRNSLVCDECGKALKSFQSLREVSYHDCWFIIRNA